MIHLLIADDEEEIRLGIRNTIDWKANGVHVCGEAADGSSALQYVANSRPDIVLIDISMPGMNGLEVMEAVKLSGQDTKFIILSGFDDFSFAQRALKVGASDYLLKPCLPEEILQTILKVKKEIELSELEKRRQKKLSEKLDESLPALREKSVAAWLRGDIAYPELQTDYPELTYRVLPEDQMMAIVIRIDEEDQTARKSELQESDSRTRIIRQEIERLPMSAWVKELVEDREELIMLRGQSSSVDEAAFMQGLEVLQVELRQAAGFSISIGIGRLCSQTGLLPLSYQEAVQAVEGRFLKGLGSIIHSTELMLNEATPPEYPAAQERALLDAIKSGRNSFPKLELEDFFSALSPDSASRERVSQCCMALLMSLFHLCIEHRTNPEDIFGPYLTSVDRIYRMQTLSQMKTTVEQVVTSLSSRFHHKRSSNKMIEQAVHMIHEHYNQELTLEWISSRLFVNPNYFCLLFKQHMEVNFVDYLHKIRIEKACELLRSFPYKTYEVASRVGYPNEKYFSRIFKQRTGLTPTQYRNSAG